MVRAFVAFSAFAGACSFTANGSTPRDASARDAGAVDAAMRDAIDAMVSKARRKEIRFDNKKVSGTLTDFVAWIDLNDADIAARAAPDGQDIFFTAADGTTRLDHALQIADRGTNHFAAWVRIPTLSDTAPTSIYVRYGDPGAASAPSPAGVFKAGFAAVWHLDDTLPATTIADATGAHAGTPTLPTTTSVPGKFGAGLKFTGNNDQITFDNPLSGKMAHTISVWVNQDPNVNHTAAIVVVGSPSGGQSRWLHGHYTSSNSFAVGFYDPDWVPNPAEVIDGAGWTYLTWVFEGSNNRSRLYKNGVEIQDSPFTPPTGGPQPPPQINTTGNAGFIGFAPEPAYGGNNGYEGTIDELRIATVARTKGWITTEYANQNSPTTFYTVGAEQMP